MRWWPSTRQAGGVDNIGHSARQRAVREAVPQLREALPLIQAEFERARRYERSVSVAVFTVAEGSGSNRGAYARRAAVPAAHDSTFASTLASVVREAVRETDLVTCDAEERRCVVVMPEIGHEEGRRAVTRMRQLCAERLSCEVRADIAVFPRDGWMFLDLVEVAQRQVQSAAQQPLTMPASNPAV